jgi:hypothetical protein
LLLGGAGCEPEGPPYGFEMLSVRVEPRTNTVHAQTNGRMRLSGLAKQALENGIPLFIEVVTEVRDAGGGGVYAKHDLRQEIRYLPLSERYQIQTDDGRETRTYPRLRHVLAELSRVQVDLETGALAPGPYEFRVRVRLDRTSLPAPMQLPALLLGNWRHDTGWSAWPFEIRA